MQSFCRSLRGIKNHLLGANIVHSQSSKGYLVTGVPREPNVSIVERPMLSSFLRQPNDKGTSCSSATSRTGLGFLAESSTSLNNDVSSISLFHKGIRPELSKWGRVGPDFSSRCITTMGESEESAIAPRIKFKRLDKTAKHIMQILDKEAVEGVREKREVLDIKPGYIIQLKVEVPENKRRVSIVKGIVIARRNCGLNTTFRLRRLVAGVGVESVFPLYSPNIKEMKILDKKKVRRAKLYYLRDKMNALKKH